MKSYEKMRNDLVASKALSEAKAVSQYLRQTTNLPVADRNRIAENYFKKTLTHKFSNLYREAAEPNIFITFLQNIGMWVTSLFGKFGEWFKMLGEGITKLGGSLLSSANATQTVSTAKWWNPFSWWSTKEIPAPGSLGASVGKILGQDITVAQAIGIAAILGLCLWGVYKLCKWLFGKMKKSESYVPMFNKEDNQFLMMMKKTSELNEGLGDLFKSGMTKFANYCISKGREVLPKLKDAVGKLNNPKITQFVSEIGPAFNRVMKSKTIQSMKDTVKGSAKFVSNKANEFAPKASQFVKDAGKSIKGLASGRA